MKNKIPTAKWWVDLYTSCPECNEEIDLPDHKDFWIDHSDLKLADKGPIHAKCPLCEHEFECDLRW